MSAAIEGMFLNTELFGHQRGASNKGYKKIKYGTMVLSTQNLHLGNANVNQRFEHGMVSPAYKTYDITGCSVELIAQWIKSAAAKRFFYNATTVGASVCRRNVEWDTLYEQPLYLPGIDEQDKIAKFLSLISERINKQQQFIVSLKKYKRGVFETVFSQKVRLIPRNKRKDWQKYKLSDFATRVTRKNGGQSDIPLTISAQYGLIDQRDFFSKTVASADMSGYYLLRSGEYAYNRSTSNDYPFGSIKRLELYPMGAVSTLYLCFRVKDDIVLSDLAKWYFESSQWHRGVNEICAEGARNHGLLNVPTDGFFNTVHTLPSDPEEQLAIASYLSLFQARLDSAQAVLEKLLRIRSGLMQRLFT
ncbi:MAG: restriction endonuclease subunit S [Intestinimonas butyriciproducens]|uniref:restriction endonuclease subunit S n=1 Tax=Intestinimonas butyriciproducens TaxID=1297617 RepID=UPI003995BF01